MMSVVYNCIDDGFYEHHTEKYFSNYIYITNSIQITNTKIALISSRGEWLLKKLTF